MDYLILEALKNIYWILGGFILGSFFPGVTRWFWNGPLKWVRDKVRSWFGRSK